MSSHEFESAAPDITRIEIERTKDPSRRAEMLAILARCDHILPSSPEAESLASSYLAAAIFPSSVPEDALHVAIAVLSRQDVIVSWNFKHLVNQRRRAAIDALNLSMAPPEV